MTDPNRLTLAQYRQQVGLDAVQPAAKPVRRNKYGAQGTRRGPDGTGGERLYRSKLEARLAARLEQERQAGGLVSFIPECSIPVGKMGDRIVRHVIDQLAILEIRPDGSFVGRFVEGKGFDAPVGKRKRNAVTQLYGVVVEVAR